MIVRTAEDLQQVDNVLAGEKIAALDTETYGLKEFDKAFSLQIATKQHQFYLDNRILTDRQIRLLIAQSLTGKETIFHNAKFDMRMMEHTWQPVCDSTIRDTGVLARLVRNDHLGYRLKDLAKREGMEKSGDVADYVNLHKLKTKVLLTHSGRIDELQHYDRVPLDVIAPYALTDARITYDIYHSLLPKLDPRSLPVWENECALTKVCYKMERRGLLVNEEYTLAALEYERGLIREAMHQFHLASGKVYDNTKAQLVEVFKAAGEIIPKTDAGNDSFTGDVLDSFTSPIAKIVQRIRFYEKRCSTYYCNFLELSVNNVIHPDMYQSGTTTGRFSYRDPNLQNLPKKGEEEERFSVRACFKPRPGYVFVAMDYSQQEYRLMLAYAKHWKLIQDVMGGMDVHTATAQLVGINRDPAKTLNFAILYGAGVDTIAQMLGCTLDQAYDLKKKYFSKLREVEILIKQVTARGKGEGYVYNWFGRKLHVNHRDFSYKLPNYLIQGGGADICKVAMNQQDPVIEDEDCFMVLQVHDAIYFEMRECDMARLVPVLKKVMIDAFPPKEGMAMNVDVQWSAVSLAERDMNDFPGQ